jgi:hypothetical protein
MHIKAREVVVKVVDEIKLTPEQWDTRGHGTVGWRDHMAKILNLRVQKLAPQYNAVDFYQNLARFAHEIGYGEAHVVAAVTERVYNVKLDFESEAA